MFRNEMRPTKEKQSRRCAKQTIATLLLSLAVLVTFDLENSYCKLVHYNLLTHNVVKSSEKKLIVLRYHNAPAHSVELVFSFCWDTIDVASKYCSDLADGDWFLFLTTKKKIRGIHFPQYML